MSSAMAFSTGINYSRAQTVTQWNRKKKWIRETLIKSNGAAFLKLWLTLNIHNTSDTKETHFFHEQYIILCLHYNNN